MLNNLWSEIEHSVMLNLCFFTSILRLNFIFFLQIQNAAFTDPDDSSAWFYHKWLLMGGKSSEVAATNPTPIILTFDVKKFRLFLSLSAPLNGNKMLQLLLDGVKVDVEWRPATIEESHDTLWILQGAENQLSQANSISVKVGEDGPEISISREKPLAWNKIELHSRYD